MNEQEIREAYAALDLPDTATKEEVEKRYELLLKKTKTNQAIDGEAVTRAYKVIIRYQLMKSAQLYDEKHYAGSKSRKAIDDFWAKYKTHVWVSVLIVIIVIMSVNTYLDKRAEKIALSKLPPSDVDVMFVGDFQQIDQDDLGVPLLTLFPEWQRIKTFLSYNPQEPKDQFDIAATQKNMLNLITEIPDIYITDRFNFELLVNQGAFMKLEAWENAFPAERLLKLQGREDDQAYLYGIDVGDVPIFKELKLYGKEEKIISLRFDTDNADNSLLFIQTLLGTLD